MHRVHRHAPAVILDEHRAEVLDLGGAEGEHEERIDEVPTVLALADALGLRDGLGGRMQQVELDLEKERRAGEEKVSRDFDR